MPFIKSIRRNYNRELTNTRSPLDYFDITGGDKIIEAGGYRIHMFEATGDHVFAITPKQFSYANEDTLSLVRSSVDCEIMIVGAGGGAGTYCGGAGGGEVLYVNRNITASINPLTVGSGGAGTTSGTWADSRHGNQSTGFGETAKPGGGGKSSDDTTPTNNGTDSRVANGGGGSSRSAGYYGSQGTSIGTGVTRYGGNRGGQTSSGGASSNQGPNYPGAGGGGSGESINGDSGATNGSSGGAGVALSLNGTSYYYGGGGGGGTYFAGTGGNGGNGGGGGGSGGSGGGSGGASVNNGASGSTGAGGPGGANSGGGGAGGRGETSSSGGNGGSGYIVVRYRT
jgi:hypothetical protein